MLRTSSSLLLCLTIGSVTLGCGGADHVDDTTDDTTDDVAVPDAAAGSPDSAVADAQA